MNEPETSVESLKRELIRRTGRKDIEVTAGPYRSYDVKVTEAPDHHPIVDFYSAMRWDPHRVTQSIDYAVNLIKNWEVMTTELDAEKKVLRPVFERLQEKFPELELNYTTGLYERHFANAEREKDKIVVNFDLWLGMKEEDIRKLEDEIKELIERLQKEGASMVGVEYW